MLLLSQKTGTRRIRNRLTPDWKGAQPSRTAIRRALRRADATMLVTSSTWKTTQRDAMTAMTKR